MNEGYRKDEAATPGVIVYRLRRTRQGANSEKGKKGKKEYALERINLR